MSVEARLTELERTIDDVWMQRSTVLILAMQLGFAFLEVGSCRRMNTVNIVCKNLSDMGVGMLAFWLFGYGLAFGRDGGNGVVGWGSFAGLADGEHTRFLFQFSFAATATTIMGGVCVERVKFSRYILFATLNMVLYAGPVHWLWSETGWLSPNNADRMGTYGALDFAGCCAVHLSAAMSALSVLVIVGQRNDTSGTIFGSSPPGVVFGTVILWLGWYAFNSGSTLAVSSAAASRTSARCFMVTTLGASAGLVGALLHEAVKFRAAVFEAPALCNGLLGGLVGITAGAGMFRPEGALAAGFVGGLLATTAPAWVERAGLDDPVNVLGVHGFAGCWGMLAVGLFAGGDELADAYWRAEDGTAGLFYGGGFELLGLQLLACAATAAFVGGGSALLVLLLQRTVSMRADHDSNLVGLDVVEHDCGHVIIAELEEMSQEKQLERQAIVNQFTNFKFALVDNSEQLFYTFSTLSPVGIFHTDARGHIKYANDRFCALVGLDSEAVYSGDWLEHVHPDDQAAVVNEWTVRVSLAQHFSMEWRFVDPRSHEVTWVMGHAVPVKLGATKRATQTEEADGQKGSSVREYFGSLTDITHSKTSETKMLWRGYQQEVVTNLGMHALHGADVSSLVDDVVPLISETLRVPTCYVTSFNEDTHAISLVSGLGIGAEFRGKEISRAGNFQSISAHVLRHKDALTITDLRVDDRFDASALPHLVGTNVVSGMGVAIRSKGNLLGTIEALTPDKRVFTREDTSFLQSFANVLATAIEKERSDFLMHENAKSDELLFKMFPRSVALALKDGQHLSEQFASASVVFVNVDGFTSIVSASDPGKLVGMLSDLYEALDRCAEANGVTKVEAVGRGYMAAAGVPDPVHDHVGRALGFALDALEAARELADPSGHALRLRVGVHAGALVAGVVGRAVPKYTCLGSTVDVAQELERTGEPGRVHVSPEVHVLAQASDSASFAFEPKAGCEAHLQTHWLVGREARRAPRRRSVSTAGTPAGGNSP